MKPVKPGKMQDEYDFSHGIRGKYARRYAVGSNVVVLHLMLRNIFPLRLRSIVNFAPSFRLGAETLRLAW